MVEEGDVKQLLGQLGVCANYKGYHYTAAAVTRISEDMHELESLSKGLYFEVAQIYHTTVACVERDIRTVSRRVAHSSNEDVLRNLFGFVPHEKVDNASMLSAIFVYLHSKRACRKIWYSRAGYMHPSCPAV